uniref:Amino acid permease/ SLC12A domain-containing protein n=1 Tax=Arion vulgaris TaxID=1028688 RepID=A0A0B7ALP3_9EUPU
MAVINQETTDVEQLGKDNDTVHKEGTTVENDNLIVIALEKVELKKSISLLGVVAILVANIGGSSIFIIPTSILSITGSPGMSMIMWTLSGIIQIGLAFSVVEVALMFNKAGGPYYFIYHTFGNLAGFVFMWGFVIFIASPTWALASYTTSLYFLSLIYKGCLPPDGVVKLVAAWIMGK